MPATLEKPEVPTEVAGTPLHKKFHEFRDFMNERLVERDEEIDLSLIALLCNEHVCLVSVPGTAKSMLSEAIVNWLDGNSFSYLLTKFTSVEEIFGPINVMKMVHEGQYTRIIDHKLPTADVAFLDEIWKGSSSILNTTLKILNERKYQNDGIEIACPLKLCISASNEWPVGDAGRELGALFDRFLLRRQMRNTVTEAGIRKIIWGNTSLDYPDTISTVEVETAHKQAMALPWEDSAQDAFMSILSALGAEGVVPGPRRYKKAGLAVNAAAWLDGSDTVTTEHMAVLADTLWVDPMEQPAVCEKIVRKIAAPLSMQVSGILAEISEVLNKLPRYEDATKASSAIVTAITKVRKSQAKLKSLGESHPKVANALRRTDESINLLQQRAMEDIGAI